MLKIAVSESFGERAKVCDYEINESGYSYTAKTLSHLKAVYGRDSELYFVIGADNIPEVAGWYRPDIITALSTIAVVARPGFDKKSAEDILPSCVVCEGESVDISSSMIRDLAAKGEDFSHLVPHGVWNYIKKHDLYPKTVDDLKQIEEFVSGFLDDARMQHTLSVQKTAAELAEKFGCDKKSAEVAALIHDVAKNLSLQEMLNYCEKYDIIIDDMQKRQKSLLHGIVAEGIAFFELGIRDSEILNAVRYHTTGCRDMETLTKIVYLADAIEPLRDYDGVDKIREAVDNLDRACRVSLDITIKHLIDKGSEIHNDTMNARNQLLEENV